MESGSSEPKWAERPAAQHEGIAVGPLVGLLFGILLIIGVGTTVAAFWFEREADAARERAVATAVYPELRQVEINSQEKLGHYRVLDSVTYQVPIERAMHVLAQRPPAEVALTMEVQY